MQAVYLKRVVWYNLPAVTGPRDMCDHRLIKTITNGIKERS